MDLDEFQARHDVTVQTSERVVAKARDAVDRAQQLKHDAQLAAKRAAALIKTVHASASRTRRAHA